MALHVACETFVCICTWMDDDADDDDGMISKLSLSLI